MMSPSPGKSKGERLYGPSEPTGLRLWLERPTITDSFRGSGLEMELEVMVWEKAMVATLRCMSFSN